MTCNPPKPRYFVTVHGPHIDGPFGHSEGLIIESPADVRDDERGNLVVTLAPRPFMPGTPMRPSRRARKSRTVIYPRGEWIKVVIGEIEPRNQEES